MPEQRDSEYPPAVDVAGVEADYCHVGPEEAQQAADPGTGEGTPHTAPERPVPESLVEKVRRTLRR